MHFYTEKGNGSVFSFNEMGVLGHSKEYSGRRASFPRMGGAHQKKQSGRKKCERKREREEFLICESDCPCRVEQS